MIKQISFIIFLSLVLGLGDPVGFQLHFAVADELVSAVMSKAEKGDADYQFQLARLYDSGKELDQNSQLAFKWYKTAAENNFVKSYYNVAIHYYYAKGTEKNDEQAFYWFKKSADQQDVRAFYSLAVMYYYGKGTSQDYN
jgi:hypothetical protein